MDSMTNSGFKYAQLELSKCPLLYAGFDTDVLPIARAEVVLAVLVANFMFELGSKEIVWNNAGVAYPTVGKESKTPEMPLKVSAIRS